MTKVLIIDDEEDITHNLNSILKKNLTKDVKIAGSFSGAKEAIAGFAPDVVFLDVNLGDRNGDDPVPLIKEPKQTPPKIIMMSAYDGEKERQQVIEKGANLFMQKPFTKEDILSSLQKVGILKGVQTDDSNKF